MSETAALLAANAAFYAAFEAGDLDEMERRWSAREDVWCVHPGGEIIVGQGPVRRSWAAVFAAGQHLQFIVTDELARAVGEVGLVTCTENILAAIGEGAGLGTGLAVATNVFVREQGSWSMVAHHASPVVRGG